MKARSAMKAAALLDLAITAPFAVPGLAGPLLALCYRLDATVFAAERAYTPPAPDWLLIASIMGILGVVWALARLQVPDLRLLWIDALARLVVAGVLVWFVAQGAARIFLTLVITEVGGSALQIWAARKEGRLS